LGGAYSNIASDPPKPEAGMVTCQGSVFHN